jgi:hypothetical protein
VLLHGQDGTKGWGEGQRSETNLLVVRGFDPATRSFRYEVNEDFGQARRGPNAARTAFALAVTARMTLGPLAQPRAAAR